MAVEKKLLRSGKAPAKALNLASFFVIEMTRRCEEFVEKNCIEIEVGGAFDDEAVAALKDLLGNEWKVEESARADGQRGRRLRVS